MTVPLELKFNDQSISPSNPVPVGDATTQARLASILLQLIANQTVALDANTLAALEQITATISGGVTVNNFPATQAVTGPLTDTQLRATPIPVDTELSAAGPLATQATLAAVLAALQATLLVDTELSATGPLATEAKLEAIRLLLAATLAVNDPGLPDTLGQKNAAGSTSVVLASDQGTVPISGSVTVSDGSGPLTVDGTVTTRKAEGTATATAGVATSTTVATLLAANANRIKATVYNDSAAVLYIKEGSGASSTSFDYALSPQVTTSGVVTTPGGLLIVDDYSGVLTGALSTGTGIARVGETT